MKKATHYIPHAVVFLGSMSIMITELTASRIISKYFGSSLYTWTGVIGVILAGISVGNFVGGRLADKYRPDRLISVLLLIASVLVFSVLGLDLILGAFMSWSEPPRVTILIVVQSLAGIVFMFFLPASAMGTISPTMAKYALERSGKVGTTVGSIYAMSAIGSIVGTFLCGYLLIPLLGTRTIIFMVGGLLGLLSLLMSAHRLVPAVWTAAIGIVFLLTSAPAAESVEGGRIIHRTDSLYAHIIVKDSGAERHLIMDGLIHNKHDRANPDNLVYDYEKLFLALTYDHLTAGGRQEAPESFSTLTVGGGAMTFPSYLSRNFRAARHEVAEIDPEVIRVAYAYFSAPRAENLIVHAIDARMIERFVDDRVFDIVYLDAFNSFSIPYHLTTVEYLRIIDGLLAEDGAVIVNCIDIMDSARFLTSYYLTLREVFPHVTVYADSGFSNDSRTTFVLHASRRPGAPEKLFSKHGSHLATRFETEFMARAVSRTRARHLRDDHAPVESLMLPVFLGAIE